MIKLRATVKSVNDVTVRVEPLGCDDECTRDIDGTLFFSLPEDDGTAARAFGALLGIVGGVVIRIEPATKELAK